MGDLRVASVAPFFSVIICVYDDWEPLFRCFRSLAQQSAAPPFEVVLVDDGSKRNPPPWLSEESSDLAIHLIRQNHAGLAAARNTGIRASSGEAFVFTDADCVLDIDCLGNLATEMRAHPEDPCFQLCLQGDVGYLVGRAEELRLRTIQEQMRRVGGYIHYLNTAGCSFRRSKMAVDRDLFDEQAIRAQDTLLLADLLRSGVYPRFVPDAIVQHAVKLRPSRYLWKGFRAGYIEGKTYTIIAALGISIRSTNARRALILWCMLQQSRKTSLGLLPFVMVAVRQGLSLLGATLYRYCGASPSAIHLSGVRQFNNPTSSSAAGCAGYRPMESQKINRTDEEVSQDA
jgi:glycosyltransferase involved in cell wall biosynthesis